MSLPARLAFAWSRSPWGASSRSRSPQWASGWRRSRSRSPQWASGRSRSPQEASGWRRSRSRSPRWASGRSRSPQWASGWSRSRSRSPQWASGWGRPPQWASSRSQSAREPSGWSRSPQGSFSRRPSPQGGFSRSRPAWEAASYSRPAWSRSPHGAFSRSRSSHGGSSRSRRAGRGRSPLATSSRNKTHNRTGNRDQPSSRSPSPQGACSDGSMSPQGATSRSPSPQGVSSRSRPCPKMSGKSNNGISPSVTDNVTGASTTSTGGDVDHRAPSSHEPPDGLYGVKVYNFANWLTNLDIKSFLITRFIRYGRVFSVTVYGCDTSRYALVFHTKKHEQEKALTGDTTGPQGIKYKVSIWSGPSPAIFGIMITNIDGDDLDLHHRITAEFGIFGDINLVQIGGSTQERIALVSYKYRKGQQNALASPKPFKTSFGKVTVTAWNKPPPACDDMFVSNVPSHQEASSRRSQSQGAFSRSPSPQGTFTRSRSPQGVSGRSQSSQKKSQKSNNGISPSVTEHVTEASITPTGSDVDPGALSSHESPDGLYGVKVSNFANGLQNKHIQFFLTEHFMHYGNVMCVAVHGQDRLRYGLVFYKQKHERERALTADTTGPYGIEFSVTTWSGPSPSIFGIMITNVFGKGSDLRRRIRSEFGIFGDIAVVKICGSIKHRIGLVFYKYRKGQQKALASPKPFKTSFGEVAVYAWNKRPPSLIDMPIYKIPSLQGSCSRSPSPQGAFSRSPSPQGTY